MAALQTLIRWFLPKNDEFFIILEKQAEILAQAAKKVQIYPLDNQVLEQIHELEHQGDEQVRTLRLQLENIFFSPIDREDIHLLSTHLDNALDHLYECALAYSTYGIEHKTSPMTELGEILIKATTALHEVMTALRQGKLAAIPSCREQIVTWEKDSDKIYRSAIQSLYQNKSIDAKELLRQQHVLFSLESATDQCQDIMDILENIAVKHA